MAPNQMAEVMQVNLFENFMLIDYSPMFYLGGAL
jgi:hypothetical protein